MSTSALTESLISKSPNRFSRNFLLNWFEDFQELSRSDVVAIVVAAVVAVDDGVAAAEAVRPFELGGTVHVRARSDQGPAA